MAFNDAVRLLAKNGKRAVKNGVRNGVNGVVNGVTNGNGIKNGVNGIDQAYRGAELHKAAEVEKATKKSLEAVYTFNRLKAEPRQPFNQLEETLKSWKSEHEPGTKQHLEDFGASMKFLYQAQQGHEGHVNFEQIYALYEKLGFSREIGGELHRMKLTGGRYGAKAKGGKFEGGPYVSSQPQAQRNVTQRSAGTERNKRLAWSNPESKQQYNALKTQRAANNKRDGITYVKRRYKTKSGETKFKSVQATGTSAWIIEHNIDQKSRWWDVWGTPERNNSDPLNTFLWNEPKWVNFKSKVERHLKSIKGEPLAIKMNDARNAIDVIHIDSNVVIGNLSLDNYSDYKQALNSLLRLVK